MTVNRECRRKHWKLWRTKIADDGRSVVVCPHCGLVATGNLSAPDERVQP
jgi:hypothetical protein